MTLHSVFVVIVAIVLLPLCFQPAFLVLLLALFGLCVTNLLGVCLDLWAQRKRRFMVPPRQQNVCLADNVVAP